MYVTIEQPRESWRCPVCALGRRDRAGTEPALLPDGVDWRQAGVPGVGGPPSGVRGLWGGAPGEDRLCRSAGELHPGLCAVCPGVVSAHDDQRRGRTPGRQLGRDQGDPEGGPSAAVRQAPAEARAVSGHRRDLGGQGAPLLDDCDGPGERSGDSRGPGKGRRCLVGVLGSAPPFQGQGAGRGHGHVARLHRGRDDPSARCCVGLRPFPRDQAVQRQALPVAAVLVPPTPGLDGEEGPLEGSAGCS